MRPTRSASTAPAGCTWCAGPTERLPWGVAPFPLVLCACIATALLRPETFTWYSVRRRRSELLPLRPWVPPTPDCPFPPPTTMGCRWTPPSAWASRSSAPPSPRRCSSCAGCSTRAGSASPCSPACPSSPCWACSSPRWRACPRHWRWGSSCWPPAPRVRHAVRTATRASLAGARGPAACRPVGARPRCSRLHRRRQPLGSWATATRAATATSPVLPHPP
jgi:hypothetical protein